MSNSDSIKQVLNIQDPNIVIHEVAQAQDKGKDCLFIKATLTYPAPHCSTCQNKTVKNGFTHTRRLLPKVATKKTCLLLKKQRFKCQACLKTSLAQTSLVRPCHSISTSLYHQIFNLLLRRRSMTEIAFDCGVSLPTVLRRLHQVHFSKPQHLPEVLSFDEFKCFNSEMAFNLFDAQTHQIIDIVPSRRLEVLKDYFYGFSKEVRDKVKVIVIDMYTPYLTLIKSCFKNAKISIDRFHIVQHIARAFNKTRIKVMKKFSKSSKAYRRLKRLWKLLQTDKTRLDVRYRYNPTFRYLTSERDIVHELLSYDASLKAYYEIYQEALQAVSLRQALRFRRLVERQQLLKASLNENFKPVFQTFKKFEAFIDHSLTLPYSNGPIEGSNNHIKVLKRIAYGYRNFTNFRNRILLVLVTAKNVQHNQEVIQNFTSDSQKTKEWSIRPLKPSL